MVKVWVRSAFGLGHLGLPKKDKWDFKVGSSVRRLLRLLLCASKDSSDFSSFLFIGCQIWSQEVDVEYHLETGHCPSALCGLC